jgi:hypothetical protein
MSETMESSRGRAWGVRFPLLFLMVGLAGCAAVSQDVDLYYRLQAHNFKEAQERASKQVASLERQASVLAASGDTNKLHRTQRQIERIKAWSEKMAKDEKRFEKAAEWTEKRFHLDRPPIEGESSDLRPDGEALPSQPPEMKNP